MSGAATETLTAVERRGHVAVIWLEDTARRNALSVGLVSQLLEALEASRQDGARAVVIASRQKAFCAGADIRDMLEHGWLELRPNAPQMITPPDFFEAIENDPRPVLAAVDGLALGGGVELCLACDLVVASQAASFMFPELGLGVLPNTALARLPELIGSRMAADLILTRRRVTADEALRLGLITRLTEKPSVVDEAVDIATDIIANAPPAALTAAKRALRRGQNWSSIRNLLGGMDAAEWREGVTAFTEKRRPDYENFWLRQVG